MLTREEILMEAARLGFVDAGFTSAEPFQSHRDYLLEHQDEYQWAETKGISLLSGIDPGAIMPGAKTILVLLEGYFRESFPPQLERLFGRCYLDDDRITQDSLAPRIRAFRNFMKERGIGSRVPPHLPHRLAAARAGLGTFGKNCLLYANRAVGGSSWILPITLILDREFPPDEPTVSIGCPEWCRSTCVVACPTRALQGNGRMDPRKCISYLTYFGEGITPRELREPMGLYVYGCDRCQNVCPRNEPWSVRERPPNARAAAKAPFLNLSSLLHMDRSYFESRVWPHMFYMPPEELWRWKMNAARAMGNSLDPAYVRDLARVLEEDGDERVRGMAVWALARIGGEEAGKALRRVSDCSGKILQEEMEHAMAGSAGGM
ncbi:MAG: epoxyqueuosine reductase [Syntrophaceae bacterium]|nr:epoxyqueuosine reductase [Syntrophaceae bacterium]